MRTKTILKIYNKLLDIASKGKDNYLEYNKYIDECINNGYYSVLLDVFIKYFYTDIKKYNTITLLKKNSFEIVRLYSNTNFSTKFKSYCDSLNVYQRGTKIYDGSNNELLGELNELYKTDYINYLGVTYSYQPDLKYYYDTSLFRKLDEASKVELKITIGTEELNNILYLNGTMSLLDKYKSGVRLLINNNTSINSYIDNNYIDNYFT
jgi:hypothetical protein